MKRFLFAMLTPKWKSPLAPGFFDPLVVDVDDTGNAPVTAMQAAIDSGMITYEQISQHGIQILPLTDADLSVDPDELYVAIMSDDQHFDAHGYTVPLTLVPLHPKNNLDRWLYDNAAAGLSRNTGDVLVKARYLSHVTSKV